MKKSLRERFLASPGIPIFALATGVSTIFLMSYYHYITTRDIVYPIIGVVGLAVLVAFLYNIRHHFPKNDGK